MAEPHHQSPFRTLTPALLRGTLLVVASNFTGCATATGEADYERWFAGEPPYGEDTHAAFETGDTLDGDDSELVDGDEPPMVSDVDDETLVAAFEMDDEAMVGDEENDEEVYEGDGIDSGPGLDDVDFLAAANPPLLVSTSEAATSSDAWYMKGAIDRARFDGWVRGWACDKRHPKRSTKVILTLRKSDGTRLERLWVTANRDSGSYVNDKCGGGTAHRFSARFKHRVPCGARMNLMVRDTRTDKPYHVMGRKLRCNPIGETFKIGRGGKITGWACDMNDPSRRNYVSVVASKGTNRKKLTNVEHGRWVHDRCSGGAKRHRFKFDLNRNIKCEETIKVYSHNLSDTRGSKNRVLIGKRRGPTCFPGAKNHRWPLKGTIHVTSEFGMRWHPIHNEYRLHAGFDLAGNTGRAVYATQAGRVRNSYYGSISGNIVEINHGNGVVTRYHHLSKRRVKKGQIVSKGQRIGDVGQTGTATRAHLHFEYRKYWEPRDPRRLF